jgi:hypothetical protein
MNDFQTAVATILGALLILVAAWLVLMRRDPERNRAKFAGLEFELSTPALIVLAAGCGLLVGPAFLPHRPGGMPPLWGSRPLETQSSTESSVLVQQTVVEAEQEPNDRAGQANRIASGQTITGRLDSTNPVDYFLVQVPETVEGECRLIVRSIKNNEIAQFSIIVWDAAEKTT